MHDQERRVNKHNEAVMELYQSVSASTKYSHRNYSGSCLSMRIHIMLLAHVHTARCRYLCYEARSGQYKPLSILINLIGRDPTLINS